MNGLASAKLYAVLEVNAGFTSAVSALGAPAPGAPAPPTITVLTNPGAGSLASSLASGIAQTAAHASSTQLGSTVRPRPPAVPPSACCSRTRSPSSPPSAIPSRPRGFGPTAFYYTLLLVLAASWATRISNSVDVALGYAARNSPAATQRPTVPITAPRRSWSPTRCRWASRC